MHALRTLMLVGIVALLAVPAAGAHRTSRGVVATAEGDVNWVIPEPNPFGGEVRNWLSFDARKRADGSARGHFRYKQIFQGDTFRFRVDVTCMGIYDNGHRAKIGGVVTYSTDPTVPPGTFGWFQAFDNGEEGEGPPDRSSLVGFGDEAANEAFCNSPNLPRFGPWDVNGDIEVETDD
jgi:hypothetical protein